MLKAQPPKPSRWEAKLNGGEDKIHGYDDGEFMGEPREAYVGMADRYLSGDPEIDKLNEPEIAELLAEHNLF
jgi:hypothetical protein